ncbi:hypothetical protein [Arenimonas aestuarii]
MDEPMHDGRTPALEPRKARRMCGKRRLIEACPAAVPAKRMATVESLRAWARNA